MSVIDVMGCRTFLDAGEVGDVRPMPRRGRLALEERCGDVRVVRLLRFHPPAVVCPLRDGASDLANFVVSGILTGVTTKKSCWAPLAKFTNQSMLRSALLMLLPNGGMAAVAAYLGAAGIASAMGGGSGDRVIEEGGDSFVKSTRRRFPLDHLRRRRLRLGPNRPDTYAYRPLHCGILVGDRRYASITSWMPATRSANSPRSRKAEPPRRTGRQGPRRCRTRRRTAQSRRRSVSPTRVRRPVRRR